MYNLLQNTLYKWFFHSLGLVCAYRLSAIDILRHNHKYIQKSKFTSGTSLFLNHFHVLIRVNFEYFDMIQHLLVYYKLNIVQIVISLKINFKIKTFLTNHCSTQQ